MRRRPSLRSLVCGLALLSATAAAAQVQYIDGVFVATENGPAELIAWAEPIPAGQLRMVSGDLDDAPTVTTLPRVLSSVPLWRPVGVLVTSSRIFSVDRPEQRQVPISIRPLSVYASEMRVAELERRDKIERLLRDVKASADYPGLAFVVLAGKNGGSPRYYPVRLSSPAR